MEDFLASLWYSVAGLKRSGLFQKFILGLNTYVYMDEDDSFANKRFGDNNEDK